MRLGSKRRRGSWGSASFDVTNETERLSKDECSANSTQFRRLETPRGTRNDWELEEGAGSSARRSSNETRRSREKQIAALAHHHFPPRFPTNSSDATREPRVLSTAMLLALSFFAVGGGPEGGEAVIVAAGPRLGLAALTFFPVLYFLPMAFVVTELVGAIPEAAGHAYWIALAFGPTMGLQAGYWAWVGNCMNCAMHSSMAIAALYRLFGWSGMPFLQYTARATLAMLLALPGFFHLRVVGSIAGSLIVFVLVPYVLIAIWSAVRAENWANLGDFRHVSTTSTETDVAYGDLLTALAWNFNGFQNLSVFAKCVRDPPRTFRRVMLISLGLTPLAYLIPILPVIALGQPSWTTWTGAGSALYSAAKYLGGSIYTIWVTVVALLSASGLYIVGLLCSAYLACGMAEKGFAPVSLRFMGLARPNSHGIDHSVIFCSLAIILIVVNLELDDMVLITNALVGLETMVLIGAAVRLRVTRRDLPRPTKLCGNAHPLVMAAALVTPFAVSGFVVGWAFTELIPSVLTGVFLFSGVVYGLQAGTTKGFRHTYESVRTHVTTTAT